MVPSYLTSWKPVILSDSENIQETTWINQGGLCYVGKGQRSLTWHQHSNMIATLRSLTQVLIGFNLKSMKILRIPGISATATSPSGDIPAKPAQFLRVPFSSLLHPAAIWNNLGSLSSPISLIHGPMATKHMSLHISYIPKCWTHNFAKFPTIYGGRIKVHGVHAHY